MKRTRVTLCNTSVRGNRSDEKTPKMCDGPQETADCEELDSVRLVELSMKWRARTELVEL